MPGVNRARGACCIRYRLQSRMPSSWPSILGLVNPDSEDIDALQAQLDILPGWAIFQRSMSQPRVVFGGDDYRPYTDAGIGVICCLEWDIGNGGTIPAPEHVSAFVERSRDYVEASSGCHVWVIGNEMNNSTRWPWPAGHAGTPALHEGPFQVLEPRYRQERYPILFQVPAIPPHPDQFPISPQHYADCFRRVRQAIKSTPGHTQDLVLVGAVAPWNASAQDARNPSGDWIQYFQAILDALEAGQCDGFALHTATLGEDPALLRSNARLAFPFSTRRAGFSCFRDFIKAVPPRHHALPVFITEVSQLQPWHNANTGWILGACEQILTYNRACIHSPIRCLALYQWASNSPWTIKDRAHLIDDLKIALATLAIHRHQDELCPVVWEQVDIPAQVAPGTSFRALLHFTNTGEQVMHCSGDVPVRLGYIFQGTRGQEGPVPVFPEKRVPLAQDVGIGESGTLQVLMWSPPATGDYQLHIGFVQPRFVWSATAFEDACTHTLSVQKLPEPARTTAAGPDRAEVPPAPGPDAPPAPDTEPDMNLDMEDPMPAPAPEPYPASRAEVPDPPAAMREILDITAFVPQPAPSQVRALEALQRIVFVETGLSLTLPLDAYPVHFQQMGFEDIPVHFVLGLTGPVYQIQHPTANPATFSRNLSQAIVLGLEGRAQTAEEAQARLHSVADAGAAILHDWTASGLPATLELGIDTLDGRPAFCGLDKAQLQGFGDLILDHWQGQGGQRESLRLSPVVLPLEAGPPESDRMVPASTGPHPSPDIPAPVPPVSQPHEAHRALQRDASAPRPTPVDAQAHPPLDLDAPDTEQIGFLYQERRGVTIWATGETGAMPLPQLKRIHALRMGDILYHFVVDRAGQIVATHRSQNPDSHLEALHARALHIGLRGDFRHHGPSAIQTAACSRLLNRLARNASLLDLASALTPATAAPLTVGMPWPNHQDWCQRVLEGALAMAAREAQSASEPVQAAQDDNSSFQPRIPSFPVDPVPDSGAERVSVVQSTTGVPHIVDKVGHLPRHPRMHFPVRAPETLRAICIHHSDAPAHVGPERLAQSLVLDQNISDVPLPGLPYHYFVHPDGQIDHCIDLSHICHAMAEGNGPVISICLAGKFINSLHPTPIQLEQTGLLVAWLMQRYYISMDQIHGHKDMDVSEAACPGDEWDTGRRWQETLMHFVTQNAAASSPTP